MPIVMVLVLFAAILTFVEPTVAAPGDLPLFASDLPGSITDEPQSFMRAGFGRACYAVDGGPSALPCNPAYLGFKQKSSLGTRVFLGNDYGTVQKTIKATNNEFSSSDTRELLLRRAPLDLETNGEIYYRRQHVGLSVMPLRYKFMAVTANQALPVAAIQAMEEQGFQVQWGDVLVEETDDAPYLAWGLQSRFAHRRFVAAELSATDLLVYTRSELFPVQRQNAVYFEPGLVYGSERGWKPRSTLMLTQLGYQDRRYAVTDRAPEVDFGSAISPPVGKGRWDLGFNYHYLFQSQSTWEQLRAVSSYTLKNFQGILGWGLNNTSVGVLTRILIFEVGVMYSHNRYRQIDNRFTYADGYFGQLGLRF